MHTLWYALHNLVAPHGRCEAPDNVHFIPLVESVHSPVRCIMFNSRPNHE